ncbi:hypothetical protein BMR07_16900 [Methylococcaceae bacterium CS1]|nr:hypothetical protein BMR11_18465 [Methylococcaceae bacterium CS5]TXL02812.1 hypothetical protein BMR07_16900 [Methylococcaceae bacterium CS1]TXL03534.1 hypothetical protein BMR08_17115 [Methylococcaceae bacterium CS2]
MANDVAEALGYSDREQAVELYCEDVRNFKEVAPEKRAFEISSKTRLIKELDIAKLIHRSPLASTGAFYDWVIPIAKRDKE